MIMTKLQHNIVVIATCMLNVAVALILKIWLIASILYINDTGVQKNNLATEHIRLESNCVSTLFLEMSGYTTVLYSSFLVQLT